MTDSGHTPAPGNLTRRRWFVFLLLGLVVVWALALVFRWELRAQWWAYQAVRAESPEELRLQVIRLASIGDKSLPAVRKLLKDARPEVREAGIDVLRYCSSGRAARELMGMLGDEDASVSGLAATGLAWRKDSKQHVELLGLMLEEGPSAWAAAVALGRIGGPQAEQILMGALADRQAPAEVRAQIIDSLGMLACLQAMPQIQEATDDTRPIAVEPFSHLSARKAMAALGSELRTKGVDPATAGEAAFTAPRVAAVAEHWLRLLSGRAAESGPAQE